MKKIYKISAISFLLVLVLCSKLLTAFAIENKYTNQLLKLNIGKTTNNKINITVTTSNPYKIKLNPIKRSDNEYVIFLPETYHSITTKPDISAVNDLQDVDVKLIPYIGSENNNGYTKITIKTKTPDAKVNVNGEVLNQQPKINNELSKLIDKNTSKAKASSGTTAKNTLVKSNQAVNRLTTKNLTDNKVQNKDIKNNKDYNTAANTSASIKKPTKVIYPESKPALVTQKPIVSEQKTAKDIKSEELKNSTVPEEIQQKAPINSISDSKAKLPAVKTTSKPNKTDNPSVKLILISLIAFLVLFILVIRYFKSTLTKQMKMAEKKAILRKPEITPLRETPPVNNIAPKSSPTVPSNKRPKRTISEPANKTQQNKPVLSNQNIKVIKGFEIEGNKGIYLIQTKYNKILIGTINSEVFLLKEFSNIQNPTLIVRKEKSLKTKNVYYVQMSNWRSLVSVAANNIKLELVLDKTLITK